MIKPLHIALAASLLLGPVIAAEAGVRTLIQTGRLPLATSSDRLADVGLANLERLGVPDVLVLGTSSIRNGLRPDVLEEAIHAATGRDVRVQGIAQSAISLRAQRLLVSGLAERGLLPGVVIMGVTPVTLTGDHQDGDWLLSSELGRLWSGCESIADLTEQLDCQLGQVSALWRWRGRPDDLLRAAERGMPRTATVAGRQLQEDGWASEPPSTRRALRREIPGALERLLERISVPAYVAIDFAALVDDLRSHGVTVITITFPYAAMLEEALMARNPAWKAQRDEGYTILEEASRSDIIEVAGFGDWWRPRSMHDLRHLSREGAGPFTQQLWEMPAFREAVLEGMASAG